MKKINKSLKTQLCKIHLTGISSAKALNKARKVILDFPCLTTEIPACHLFFSSKDIADGDTRFKNFPPIRDTENW